MKIALTVLFCFFSITASNAQIQDDRYPQQRTWTQQLKVKKQTIHYRSYRADSTIIGGRPAGCPHRFCGCALAIKLFGRIVPHLNLATNWLRFPRTGAAPGMVAVRRGHVFKLMAHAGGSVWKSWDANSGGGRIRIHNRSIAGYVIVNPTGRG